MCAPEKNGDVHQEYFGSPCGTHAFPVYIEKYTIVGEEKVVLSLLHKKWVPLKQTTYEVVSPRKKTYTVRLSPQKEKKD